MGNRLQNMAVYPVLLVPEEAKAVDNITGFVKSS